VIVLPDVNVLVAIAWPEHVFHDRAIQWFDATANSGWATTSVTELGFIRVSSNPAAVVDAVRPAAACAFLVELRAVGDHRFWVDDEGPSTADAFPRDRLIGHSQVTDAHLLALAARHDGAVATFDTGLVALARGTREGAVCLIGGSESPTP
jgi:uncharacterized protein